MTWTDVEDIAIALVEHHPDRDPLSVRFTELRGLVEQLPGFHADPDHHVNEQILEAIQAAWHEEKEDADEDDDDGERRYSPVRPFSRSRRQSGLGGPRDRPAPAPPGSMVGEFSPAACRAVEPRP